ncbi:hypothetical protein SKAU_G00244180 [Synaphobranchus kaupii]|uniref:ZP domain-containing protein n=1 Tax=Synaphobranchus kaupii TaxID=118154 RepID=A0A9Q1F1K8_SYNKA|nr:hypothetical protein SKAU_G00244180 [Synaphobranchus kaupii]
MCLCTILLLSFLSLKTHTFDIQGGLMTFRPVKRHSDGTITVSFHYKESYRGQCAHQLSWDCESGGCGQVTVFEVTDADKDVSDRHLWCQSGGRILRRLSSDKLFTLRDTGCCWVSNLNNAINWTFVTTVDMGKRSDTYNLNKSPVMTMVPTIRMPQNCFTTLPLLSHDPDGDKVRCRFNQANECGNNSCHQHPNFTLNETLCTLQMNNSTSIGVHIFKMVVEDYPTQSITLSYKDGNSSVRNPLDPSISNSSLVPLSQLPLHFAVEIGSPLATCVSGVVRPQFLFPTPAHGDVYYAALGQALILTLRAQATHSQIYDFQLSGPYNMTKKSFQNDSDGIAQVHVTWTPQESDIFQHVPVCFTAETRDSQSEMRCIVVIIERYTLLSVDANISCMDNTISITLRKDSMKGVEASQLYLKDPTCTLTSNGTHIMATVSFSSCGTKLEDAGDHIIFKNEINSVKEASVITRRNLVKIPFSCRYSKQADITANFRNHKSDYVFTETGFGSFSFSFEFYTDNTFHSRINPSSYPVEVKLLDKIHMGIRAQSSLSNIELFVESCKATPDDDPNNALYYDIIKNGCSMDETLVVSSGEKTEFMLEMQAFKFSGDFEEVYISCSVIMCDADSSHSRCAQGCVSNSMQRSKRELPVQTHKHVITQGPLRLQRRHTVVSDTSSSDNQSSNTGTLVFAGLFIAMVLVLVGVMFYYRQQSRPLDRTHLLSSF